MDSEHIEKEAKIKVGISSCLLGNPVRFNGGHTRDRFVTDTLGKYFEYYPVCPEVESGFGIPREPFRLVGDSDAPRLMTVKTRLDCTEIVQNWATERVTQLERENLCGFIFMSKSPSSGMERVKVYTEQGMPSKTGVGLFAKAFMNHFPLIPVEEDGRLHDPVLRESFIERVFVMKRWRETSSRKKSRRELIEFHTRHKLLILCHSQSHYREMGKFVAQLETADLASAYTRYQAMLMEALRLRATQKKHVNVLQHVLGYFKKNLSADEKQEMLELISLYAEGHIPLIVPITLLNHYVRKFREPYLSEQYYLNPHPIELQLRNHV
jgi:uncharacterized protein YbgA (DUF1722 family)/uncharacterized protein YbbK (DUF523 family)